MIQPEGLKPNDLIYITAPAKAIETETVLATRRFLESWGYRVKISANCLGRFNYFSGTDEERLADFQLGIDDFEVKAVLCARGGYGCVRIVNHLDWTRFKENPKWIIGFSDVTVFHQKLHRLGYQSIHSIMPLGFLEGTEDAKNTLKGAMSASAYELSGPKSEYNCFGAAIGGLIGGNLTIIHSLLGTPLSYSFENKILFIEDVGEHVYKIDRMLQSLKLAGVFNKISGLVVGAFTEIEDTDVPFGKSIHELILNYIKDQQIPVAFDFPIGHINDNRAIVVGKQGQLTVDEKGSTLLI